MAKRKKRYPFGFGFWDEDFERMREEMDKVIESMLRGFGEFEKGKFEEIKGPYVYGFSVKMGPEGKPIIREFGNKPIIGAKGEKGLSMEREPLVDVIEGKEEVTVIAELPGITKEDIKLTGGPEKLEIKVDTPKRKYHKIINLPCKVKLEKAKATYKNGVLKIVIERIEKKKEERKEKRIKIE